MTSSTPSSPSSPGPRGGSSRADAVLATHPIPEENITSRTTASEGPAAGSVAPAAGPWADTLGRAGSRAAQVLLIATVAAGFAWLLLRVQLVVVAVLVALILASAVAPLVKWLVGKGWSHLWATLTAFLAILAVVGALITAVVLAVRRQWDSLVTSAVGGWDELQDWVMSGPLPIDTAVIDNAARQATDFVTSGSFTSDIADNAITGLTVATEVLTGTVLMLVILFFFLKDGAKMWNFALRWFRGGTRAKLAESIDRSAEVLGGYVRGTAIVALVDAVVIGLGLVVVGVPLALPLAVIVFIGAFIPIVGATVAGILAALVALITTGPIEALIVVGIVIAVNQLEGDLLQPVVMGHTLSLNALVVLLALTVGTLVGGVFGAILAVPYTAVAWTVIQIWTTQYQAGHDPVLGEDPLDPQDRVQAKATMAQRWRYQRMLREHRRGRPLGAVDQDLDEDAASAQRLDPPASTDQ